MDRAPGAGVWSLVALELVRQGSHLAQHTLLPQTCLQSSPPTCPLSHEREITEDCPVCELEEPAKVYEDRWSQSELIVLGSVAAGGPLLTGVSFWLSGFRRVVQGRRPARGRGRYVRD